MQDLVFFCEWDSRCEFKTEVGSGISNTSRSEMTLFKGLECRNREVYM